MKKQSKAPTSFPISKFKVITQERIEIPDHNQMSEQERTDCELYKKFLTGKGLPADLLPFFPYYPLNIKFFPGNTIRVYLAKLSTEKKNDYVLIAVPCRAVKEKTKKFYKDQVTPAKRDPSGEDYTNYTLINYRYQKFGMKITYRSVYEAQIPYQKKYIDNFIAFLKQYKLEKYFPFAFILRKKTDKKTQHQYIKIRPTLIYNDKGGLRVEEGVQFQVCGSEADTCCQSPPEQGPTLDITLF
jgi:hypothetical protein